MTKSDPNRPDIDIKRTVNNMKILMKHLIILLYLKIIKKL